MKLLTTEPVRLYAIATAAIALLAYLVPSGAWPLVGALVAAVLGVGETVRHNVTPTADPRNTDGRPLVPLLPGLPHDDEPTTGAPEAGAVSWATVALVVIAVVLALWALGEVPAT